MNSKLTYWVDGNSCCNARWEDAYNRFETEDEEIQKFQNRLLSFGAARWSRRAKVVDLFCGSGRNLLCLERMGFLDLHGVDLSPRLLDCCTAKANLYVGDATSLGFPDNWADIVFVQGGLHHLPNLSSDLGKVFDEIHRILKHDGLFVMVEPWSTPFLNFVHWCCRQKTLCNLSTKLDALATMVEEEKETYFNWLSSQAKILHELNARFLKKSLQTRMGKVNFLGFPSNKLR